MVWKPIIFFGMTSSSEDSKKSRLHWLGLHGKTTYKNFHLELSGIYNFGKIREDSGDSEGGEFALSAFLWGGYFGYEFRYWQIGFRHEGATGDNIRDENDAHSFQTIAHSHGLSYIFIDDSGGFSIRGAGSLFGSYAHSIELIFRYFRDFDMGLKYFHFRSIRNVISSTGNSSSNYLGDEINAYVKYLYAESLYFELTSALFSPNDAYTNWFGAASQKVVVEVLLKAQASY